MKLEVIHPNKPYVFCAATVVKSLGPYYFLIATDKTDNIPSVTMCCHSESSNIFPPGWSYKNGIEFTVPSGKFTVLGIFIEIPPSNTLKLFRSIGVVLLLTHLPSGNGHEILHYIQHIRHLVSTVHHCYLF